MGVLKQKCVQSYEFFSNNSMGYNLSYAAYYKLALDNESEYYLFESKWNFCSASILV